MLRLLSATVLTAMWAVALSALMTPGIRSIEDGLVSGKRIALAQYVQQHPCVEDR
jgi:hypothetical protein